MVTRPISNKKATSSKPTISELAAHLSLTKGTVSLILNNRGERFSEETRRRVLAAAKEIGYSPDPLARALATGRTGFIALWVQTLETSYYAQVANEMEKALENHEYQIAVTPFGRFNRNLATYSGIPVGVDAMIAHEIYGDILPLLFQHNKRKVPVITTGTFAPPESRDHVQVDLTQAAEEAVRYLVSSGHRRIAYASDDVTARAKDPRFEIYHAVLAESGLPAELIGFPRYSERKAMRSLMVEYIRAQGCPDAILCHNDDTAIAVYRALADEGLRLPDDCALIGCDGIPETEFLSVPITTIVQPYAAMCETACQFLERRLAVPDAPPQRATLRAMLDFRQSS